MGKPNQNMINAGGKIISNEAIALKRSAYEFEKQPQYKKKEVKVVNDEESGIEIEGGGSLQLGFKGAPVQKTLFK